MLKLRASILLGLFAALPAQAGLFSDDEARKSVQQLDARVLKVEEQDKQQTQSIFDLQGQIDALNAEIRKLRGQNEELAHGLQDAEKREKDFYVDLDTRLRHFESAEVAAPTVPAATKSVEAGKSAEASADTDDFATENRAIESAYGLIKAGNNADAAKSLQDFIKKYPSSVHMPNALFWQAGAYVALKDCKGALVSYRALLKAYPDTAKAPETLYGIASCQQTLKAPAQATATLKQLVSKYPDSAVAAKAKKQLSAAK